MLYFILLAGLGIAIVTWLARPSKVVMTLLSLLILGGFIYGLALWSAGKPKADQLLEGAQKQTESLIDNLNERLDPKQQSP